MEYKIKEFIEYLKDCYKKETNIPFYSRKEIIERYMINKLTPDNIASTMALFGSKLYYEHKLMDLNAVLEFFLDGKDVVLKKHKIFIDFKALSEYLAQFPANNKDRFMIMMEVIKNNLDVIINSENKNIKAYNIFEIQRKGFEFVIAGKIKYGMGRKNKESDKRIEIDKFIKYHKIIQQRYLEKMNSFNEEDIKIIIETLKDMLVNDQMCNEINELLMKEYRRRIKNETKENESIQYIKQKPKTVVQNKTLSKKEYHDKEIEINKYFDLKQMCPIRYISMQEKIELIMLLQELNYQDIHIEPLLKMIDLGNKEYQVHPMIKYMSLIDKIIYYKEQVELTEQQLEDLEYNFRMLLMCDNSEYTEWKDELGTALQPLERLLPKTHEFEIEQAKKASVLVKR